MVAALTQTGEETAVIRGLGSMELDGGTKKQILEETASIIAAADTARVVAAAMEAIAAASASAVLRADEETRKELDNL